MSLFDSIPWGHAPSGLPVPAGASKYRVGEQLVVTAETDVDRANKIDSMAEALQDWDCDVPADSTSWKMHCPWAFEHDDGGKLMSSKTARYYGGANAVMCFKMHGWMTPVRLRARKWGLTQKQAAQKILRAAGEGSPGWYRQRWFDLQAKKEQQVAELPDPQHAVAALHVALRGVPTFPVRQYDEDVRSVLESCLEALVDGLTVEQMRDWLESSLDQLRKIL